MTMRYHNVGACEGRHCAIHNPSPHHMRTWPITVRETGLVERVCEHGVGHPDPDSVVWMDENAWVGSKRTWGVHGCDGCCSMPGALDERVVAPDGFMYFCPDCDSGGCVYPSYVKFHAEKMGHGEPELRPWPTDNDREKYLFERWDGLLKKLAEGHNE